MLVLSLKQPNHFLPRINVAWTSTFYPNGFRIASRSRRTRQSRCLQSDTSISIQPRQFSTGSPTQRQKLYWCGSVLDRTSPELQPVPRDWLKSVGMATDADQGISWTNLSSSPSHTLLSYITLPHPTNPSPSNSTSTSPISTSEDDPIPTPPPNPEGLHKVMSIGRNSVGELGLGFASQESTWGMCRPGFQGQQGIEGLATGLGTSWIVCKDDQDSSRLYSFGNHTSSQLGHGFNLTTSTSGESQLQLYPTPRQVDLSSSSSNDQDRSESQSIRILKIVTGLDHTLLLIRRLGQETNEILVCGLNTDGQLGLGPISPTSISTFKSIPKDLFPISSSDQLIGISAGGDTSFAWTKESKIFSWGNSEYGQALGGEVVQQIVEPREIKVLEKGMGKVKDVKVGGSFVLVLDDLGQVFTCGYGAIGQGSSNLSTLNLTPLKLPLQPKEIVSSIFSGLEYAVVATNSGRLFCWGLDSAAGRLGLGSKSPYPSFILASRFTQNEIELRVYEPVEIKFPKKEQVEILKVALGRDAMWVLVEDGREEVGRWDSK